MNRLKLANANHNAQLILALVLMTTGLVMMFAGLDCWPRLIFGMVAWMAGIVILADLIVKKRRGQRHVEFHDELTNRFYYGDDQQTTKCPICGISSPSIITIERHSGVECPECGPIFFDLFKEGFYGRENHTD